MRSEAGEAGPPSDHRLSDRLRRTAAFAGCSVVALGSVVLAGWAFDVDVLRSISPGLASMKANTALAFVLLGVSILSFGMVGRVRPAGRLGYATAWLTALIGLLTLSEYLAGWDVGIDEVLFRDPTTLQTSHPGRMAPTSAACFLALGIALIVLDRRARWARWTTPVLSFSVMLTAVAAVLGYLYGVSSLYRVSVFSSMALHTAVGFVVASIGALLLRPERAPLLSSPSAGGIMLRRITPAAAVAIVVLGEARLRGEQAGYYTTEFGLALMVLGTIVVVGGLTWLVARSLHRVDQERLGAEAALRQLNLELEERVDARTADLAASEEQYRALTATAPDGIISAHEEGVIFYVNEAARQMFGGEDLVGRELTTLMPDRYRNAHLEGVAHFVAGGQPRVIGRVVKLAALRGDGTEFPIELSLSSWRSGGKHLFTGIVRDITERVRAEESERRRIARDALAARAVQAMGPESDLSQAFMAFADTVRADVAFERASLAVRSGEAEARILAVAGPDDWRIPQGQSVRIDEDHWQRYAAGLTVVTRDTASEATSVDRELARAGIRSYVSVPIAALGEARAVISFSSSQPDDFPPEVVSVLEAVVRETAGTFNTILLLHRERETAARLRELDALKSEFVSTVAHDLRSPMTVIAGFAEMLQFDGDTMPAEERNSLLGRIVANTNRLSDLVADVLDVARIDSGDLKYEMAPFDLVALIRRTVEEATMTQPGRTCRLDLPSHPITGFGDADRYWRVLTNLLSNAFKFSPQDAPVEVAVTAGDTEIAVCVSDHGQGIDPDDLPRLFLKFSRVTQQGAGPKAPGTGLGLYISKHLVEGQGGTMWVESTPGEGSRFHFTVPTPRGRT